MPLYTTLSPAMQFLWTLWEGTRWQSDWRPTRVYAGMREALFLANRQRLRFAPQDFVWLNTPDPSAWGSPSRFDFAAWAGVDHGKNLGEQFYSTAVHAQNRSAAVAFETWRGRQPFFWHGMRLHVGSNFTWEGRDVAVTSFDDVTGTLTACAYVVIEPWTTARPRVPARRWTVTPKQLREAQRRPGSQARKES